MYCMNCGKEISGNIPICGECLQSVLDKHKAEQDILTRVNLEAQPFSIKEVEEEPVLEDPNIEEESETLSGDNDISSEEFHSQTAPGTQSTNDDDNTGVWIAWGIILGIVGVIIICAALA